MFQVTHGASPTAQQKLGMIFREMHPGEALLTPRFANNEVACAGMY